MNYTLDIKNAKQYLKDAGVAEAIIDSSFVEEDITDEIDVMGSIIEAVTSAGMDYIVAESIIDKVYNKIHPMTVEVEPDTFKVLVDDAGIEPTAEEPTAEELAAEEAVA